MRDEDEEEHSQDNSQDEEKDNNIKTYCKKSHFGKSSRDIRLLNTRTSYKFKSTPLKNVKITIEAGKQSLADSFIRGMKCKVEQKGQFKGINSSVKLNLLLDQQVHNSQGDLNATLKKSFDKNTVAFNGKITSKNEQVAKVSHLLKYWDRFRLIYFLEGERKRGISSHSAGLNLIFKRNLTAFPWIPFISRYNEQIGAKATIKSSLQLKPEFYYKGNFITNQKHQLYLQHKLIYNNALANTLTLNCQDNLGILTFNTSLSFQNLILKSKQVRLLMQFNRIYRFGVQKRNQDFEFIFQRFQIKSNLLRTFKLYVGNKGFLTSLEGKLKPLTICDYKIHLQIKPQQNIFDAIRAGFELKFNLQQIPLF